MAKHWWTKLVVGRTSVSDPLQESDRPDARFEAEWRPLVKSRLLIVVGILALWAVGLEARLVYLQVVQHEGYAAQARKQQQAISRPEGPRGDITDRNGELLAYSVESFDLHADPMQVKDAPRQARELCDALADCTSVELAEITAAFSKPGSRDVLVRAARDIAPDAVDRVRALMTKLSLAAIKEARANKSSQPEKNKGPLLWLDRRYARYYPKLGLASHVVGFVRATDGAGGAGVESHYDKFIKGVEGRVYSERDGKTDELFTRVDLAPRQGVSVELTIDMRLQHIAERELKAQIIATGASSGSVVILDPATGAILALVSYPTFNPNGYRLFSDDDRRNRAVQDTYEPGSTFKMVTASAAINEGVMNTSQLIDTNPGFLKFPGRKPIEEAHGKNYHVLSFEDVIVESSNIGAVKIGLQVGAERMSRYVRGFGFGASIAPEFPGESKGRVNGVNALTDSALASMSMGYEISVTPIQIAAAANAIANGGVLMAPHVLRATIRDGRREVVAPKVLRRVIEPSTALTLTTIMEDVVKDGTGKPAALPRYMVAGKTGTAAKAIPGGYSKTDYNVSFVGFVPSRAPVYTILVVVDSPRKVPAYGGPVAGPVFKRIAQAALEYAGVPPTVNPAPTVIIAENQRPLPQVPPTAPVAVVKAGGEPVLADGRVVMPDVRGMSMRDALRVTQKLGLQMTTTDGDGLVVVQSPSAGVAVEPGAHGTLQLRRDVAKSGGGNR